MRCPSLRHLLPLLLVVAACAHTPTAPLAKLEDAARAGPGADARSRALAGFHSLFVTGDAAQAAERFQSALLADPDEPLAHLGHLLLAERDARLDQQFAASLALVQRAPQHPLSAVGARKLLELTGQVPVVGRAAPRRAALRSWRVGPGWRPRVLVQSVLAEIHKGRHAVEPLASTLDRAWAWRASSPCSDRSPPSPGWTPRPARRRCGPVRSPVPSTAPTGR